MTTVETNLGEVGTLSKAFAAAIVRAQGSIEEAKKTAANPHLKTKYANLSACWDACREALQQNEIAVLQFPIKADPGHVGMATVLVYGPTGEVYGDEYQVPLKDPTNAQALGSAITYARRYALCSVIGICPEDDDGHAASNVGKARNSVPQAKQAPQGGTAKADEAGFRAKFGACKDYESRKQVYLELKNSGMQEPEKTALLKEFGDAIKAEKEKTKTS